MSRERRPMLPTTLATTPPAINLCMRIWRDRVLADEALTNRGGSGKKARHERHGV
jgi:hypothetical protein